MPGSAVASFVVAAVAGGSSSVVAALVVAAVVPAAVVGGAADRRGQAGRALVGAGRQARLPATSMVAVTTTGTIRPAASALGLRPRREVGPPARTALVVESLERLRPPGADRLLASRGLVVVAGDVEPLRLVDGRRAAAGVRRSMSSPTLDLVGLALGGRLVVGRRVGPAPGRAGAAAVPTR